MSVQLSVELEETRGHTVGDGVAVVRHDQRGLTGGAQVRELRVGLVRSDEERHAERAKLREVERRATWIRLRNRALPPDLRAATSREERFREKREGGGDAGEERTSCSGGGG